jgi:hypothetical protein
MGSALPVRVFVEMNTPPELTAHTNKRVTMRVLIRTIDQRDIAVDVDVDVTTVSALKLLINSRILVPEDRQRLIYRGQVLDDTCTLKEYQIEDEHVIHLVQRPQKTSSQTLPASEGVASSENQSPPPPPSFEHIRQGFMSIRTVMSSLDSNLPRSNDGNATAFNSKVSCCVLCSFFEFFDSIS